RIGSERAENRERPDDDEEVFPLNPPPAREERVDLLPLVQDAVARMEPAARARKIRFDVSVSPRVQPVCGDRDLLLTIVISLLENAARYSPDRESVDITLEPTARGQMLVVRDHGPGVPESERERIFQRYEQGRPSPYAMDLGLGLGQGLYIA